MMGDLTHIGQKHLQQQKQSIRVKLPSKEGSQTLSKVKWGAIPALKDTYAQNSNYDNRVKSVTKFSQTHQTSGWRNTKTTKKRNCSSKNNPTTIWNLIYATKSFLNVQSWTNIKHKQSLKSENHLKALLISNQQTTDQSHILLNYTKFFWQS